MGAQTVEAQRSLVFLTLVLAWHVISCRNDVILRRSSGDSAGIVGPIHVGPVGIPRSKGKAMHRTGLGLVGGGPGLGGLGCSLGGCWSQGWARGYQTHAHTSSLKHARLRQGWFDVCLGLGCWLGWAVRLVSDRSDRPGQHDKPRKFQGPPDKIRHGVRGVGGEGSGKGKSEDSSWETFQFGLGTRTPQ